MVEFCKKCGGMMLPSKENGENLLACILCSHTKPFTEELINSYKFNKEIFHPPGEEFKKFEELENWKEKEIYNIFK